MYLYVLLFLGVVIILGLLQRENESRIAKFIILAFLLLMMAASIDNPDYTNYLSGYNNLERLEGLEWGYYLLAKLCTQIGLNYNQFRFVIAAIGLILIHQTISKFLYNSVIFYVLYFFCPFMMDVTQLRNFIAMSFFIFAIPYLLENGLKNRVKYIIAIILGASFQISSLIYIPIVFVKDADKNRTTKNILYLAAALSLVVGLNRSTITSLMSYLTNLLGSYDERLSEYSVIGTHYGFLINWCLQIATFILIKWAKYAYELADCTLCQPNTYGYSDSIKQKEDYEIKLIKMAEIINTYAFLFLPFYVIESTYSRLMRNIVPLNIIVLILACKKNCTGEFKITMEGALTAIFLLLYVGVLFYVWIYMDYSESIVQALFSGNWFFNLEWSNWGG